MTTTNASIMCRSQLSDTQTKLNLASGAMVSLHSLRFVQDLPL